MKTSSKLAARIKTRQWLPAVVVILGLLIIAPQLRVFHASLRQLQDVDRLQLLLAVVATGLTFVAGALVYKILAFKHLSYSRTLVAQVAANFINRLLPAGIGGIGVNYRYLRRQKHSSVQAASVVAVNNSLGLLGHLTLILVLVTAFHAHTVPIHVSATVKTGLLVMVVLILLVVMVFPKLRLRFQVSLAAFGKQLSGFRTRLPALSAALLVQICLTLCNITAFWLCVLAVHVSLSFVAALLVFSFGFGVGAATPTPGGLGGVEAGLVAGLVTYHVASPTAIAAVLVYRLVSYWLPLLVSGLFFVYASRQKYFG
jgi:uncharacterized protein (TIRG00374 family)